MALAQAVAEPFVKKTVDPPTSEQRSAISPVAGEGINGESGIVTQMRGGGFSLAGIVIDPNSQVRLGDERTVVLTELVRQDQFAGIAAALDDVQMQIQAAGYL